LCASPALHAQEKTVWPTERPISKSAERIARELWPTDVATSTIDEEGRPMIGGSVDPGSIYQSIRNAWRDWQARRIHKRVMRELEELERLNRAAEEVAR
jgi:hypothetical protein